MDPAALRNTLARLERQLPLPASLAGEAMAAATAAAQAAARLQTETRAATAPEEAMGRVGEALEGFAAFATQRRAALETAFAGVEQRVAALADCEERAAALGEGAGGVESAFAGVQQKLADGGPGAEQVSLTVADNFEKLFLAAEQSQELLGASLEVATVAFAQLQDGLRGGERAVLAELDAFVDNLVAREDEVVAATDDHVARAFAATTVMVEKLEQDYPAYLNGEVAKALEIAQEGVQGYIQGLVRRAMDDVVASFEGFEKKVNEAEDGSQLARKVLEPLFEDFGRVAEPLVRSLDSIRDAGRGVGVDF
jgi:hypothetical protein